MHLYGNFFHGNNAEKDPKDQVLVNLLLFFNL